MELVLTDDQVLFRETTRRFLESSCPLTTVRQLAESEPAGFERDWWRRGAELGWTSMLVPEEQGGGTVSGAGLLDLSLVAEELGRLVSPGPFLAVNVVVLAVAESGSAEQRDQVLPGLASGETIASWCLAEPGHPWTADGVQLTAEAKGDGYVLNGVKGPVEAAAEADLFLVTARLNDHLAQFLVPARTDGLAVLPANSLDLVRRFGEVHFTDVAVPASTMVGSPADAAGAVARQLEVAVALQCAEMVGATQRVFEFTVEYSFDRYSFGRPLASYQALKHRFADMKLWLEASHATEGGAVAAVQERRADAGTLTSAAKSFIGDHSTQILQDCVQMHGGIGVTWDHDLHLYIRRVTQDRATYGTPRDHRERVAQLIGL